MMDLLVHYPDWVRRTFFPARVLLAHGRISSVEALDTNDSKKVELPYMMPGLVDAHVHVESSMVVPSRFAQTAVRHGTVATVSDPHEIANVLGADGVEFMLSDAETVPLKFHFTVPSCVPATDFEQSGARLGADEVSTLLKRKGMVALGEMMNYPGVLSGQPEVMQKIEAARKVGLPVDGHAPGLMGNDLNRYIGAGISTDHEAFDYDEALEKVEKGMHILIREGSAAKNFETLHPLISSHTDQVMLCSDDLHPDDLLVGHINRLVQAGLKKGYHFFDLLQVASLNPIRHYRLEVGQLRPGDPADFVLVNHPAEFEVLETWIDGQPVYQNEKVLFELRKVREPNVFIKSTFSRKDFVVPGGSGGYRVIVARDGDLVTGEAIVSLESHNQQVQADPERDVLKIAVVNRYQEARPAVGFIQGMGLKRGAIGSSVAHDSHNIIVAGTSDEEMAAVVNALMGSRGGIALSDGKNLHTLPLPVGGIMSGDPVQLVARKYAEMTVLARQLGSTLKAPFMTLSFMALLVIPDLKIGDRGLFDTRIFDFVSIRSDE